MSKAPQVRINVGDLDRLLLLTETQLKVWLYYKRREGESKQAWGKTSSIATACGFTKPTSATSIRNTRAWLVRNGWMRPNGRSKSGLPMFLAVIPRLHLEAPECNPQITPHVIPRLHPVQSTDYTEVPTLKKQPLKDSALASGRKEGRNSSLSPDLEIESEKPELEVQVGEAKEQRQPKPTEALSDSQTKIQTAWVKAGGRSFRNGDAESATSLVGVLGLYNLIGYIDDTFLCPKTANVTWRDFGYWADSMSIDAEPSTQRNIDAWRRGTKAKAAAATRSNTTNPNCSRCKGPTYGSPQFEDDKPFCQDCMKLPTYRRDSGERTIMSSDI